MEITVVIPVYNAEKYLTKSVESALSQPQVGEIILIEDRSPDKSLELCMDLQSKHSKVKVLRHADNKNLGAAESRNLGIRSAKHQYIAFLDADDYFLPERFDVPCEILTKYKDIDGVYESIGMHFYSDTARKKWLKNGGRATDYNRQWNYS